MTETPSEIVVRRLTHRDLPAALILQSQNYPAFLREDELAFASRLETAVSCCFAAELDGALIGYLLAHGWPRQSPLAPGSILPKVAAAEVLFIHDLAVSQVGRGLGGGRKLVAAALELAGGQGLGTAELIAIEGAAGYWRGLGFIETPVPTAIATKVASYGAGARWMTKKIGA